MAYGTKEVTGSFTGGSVFEIQVLEDATWTMEVDTDRTEGYDGVTGDTTKSFSLDKGTYVYRESDRGKIIYYKNINVTSGKLDVAFWSN